MTALTVYFGIYLALKGAEPQQQIIPMDSLVACAHQVEVMLERIQKNPLPEGSAIQLSCIVKHEPKA